MQNLLSYKDYLKKPNLVEEERNYSCYVDYLRENISNAIGSKHLQDPNQRTLQDLTAWICALRIITGQYLDEISDNQFCPS